MASGTLELDGFVREALARGASRDSIATTLASAGWSSEQIRRALHAYAEVDFVVPVPLHRTIYAALLPLERRARGELGFA